MICPWRAVSSWIGVATWTYSIYIRVGTGLHEREVLRGEASGKCIDLDYSSRAYKLGTFVFARQTAHPESPRVVIQATLSRA